MDQLIQFTHHCNIRWQYQYVTCLFMYFLQTLHNFHYYNDQTLKLSNYKPHQTATKLQQTPPDKWLCTWWHVHGEYKFLCTWHPMRAEHVVSCWPIAETDSLKCVPFHCWCMVSKHSKYFSVEITLYFTHGLLRSGTVMGPYEVSRQGSG